MLLSKKEIDELEKILRLKYASFLKSRFFTIECGIGEECCEAKIILKNDDESFYYPVEAKIERLKTDLKDKEAICLMIDYIDIYFDNYFKESESTFLPIDWSAYDFEGEKIYIKGQVLNLECEKKADVFLEQSVLTSL